MSVKVVWWCRRWGEAAVTTGAMIVGASRLRACTLEDWKSQQQLLVSRQLQLLVLLLYEQ